MNASIRIIDQTKETTVTITPGELRGRTQPTIMLRMTSEVTPAPDNTDGDTPVFREGVVVFAQYVGNGRLILTPIDPSEAWGPQVVMASALNTTAEILPEHELAAAFDPGPRAFGVHCENTPAGIFPSARAAS